MVEKQPIFQSIFGESWQALPKVMQRHYANRPFSQDLVTVEGTMEVTLSALAKLGAPLLRLTKTLVPKAGKNIAVTVSFRSEPHSKMFCFDREFRFADGSSYRFYSRLEPVGGAEVVEWTSSGIGWHAAYSFQDGKVLLKHLGYSIKLFGKRIPLPLGWVFGRSDAHEIAISDSQFEMSMAINHPVFGKFYGYGGTFTLTDMKLDD